MKKLTALLLFVSLAAFISCSKGDSGGHHGMMKMDNIKIVKLADRQVTFELMDKAAHDKMAKMMKMDHEKMAMHGDKDSDHFISISVLKGADKSPVKDAEITASVTGPDGKTVTRKGHIMEGGGMFHYAIDLKMKDKGDYKVSADIKTGDKSETAEATFTIK